MIEVIFVIAIIGILAATVIPKLYATRDDAKLAEDVSKMATCIEDAGLFYTSRGVDMQENDSRACSEVVCYTITYGTDGSNFVVVTHPENASFCANVDNLGGHLAKTYRFKGTNISF